MSLVSYADSDDSSDNEQDERQVRQLLRKPRTNNIVVDKKHVESDDNFDGKTKPKSIGNLFSSLPAPWRSSVSWASKGSSGKSVKKERTQQTVKISLPFVEESDSDDETQEEGKRKQISGSQKHSGLSSILPKPKHSIVVTENNPNRPMTKISNRPLIPDSLRRKRAKGAQSLPQHKKLMKKQDSDDEDDDQESSSFFSFTEQEPPVDMETTRGDRSLDMKPETSSVSVGSEILNSRLYDASQHLNLNNSSAITNTSSIDVNEKGKHEETNETLTSQPSYSNAGPDPYPVQHSINVEIPSGNFGEPNPQATTTYYSNAGPEPYYNYNYDQHNQNMQQTEDGTQWFAPEQIGCASDVAIDDDIQFKKLQGKRARGEENIEIIDVNADDQVGSASEWKSRYQREDAEYKPQSKKKGNMPSNQQRRKHQITYLAFQAKETEWELRNQWAANSQTRRQTQSRYGF